MDGVLATDRDRSCRSGKELGRSRFGLGAAANGWFPGSGPCAGPPTPLTSGRGLGPDAGEIGHGGRQQELGLGLEVPSIARLTQAQLHQTRQTVFGRLEQDPIGCKGRAGLQGLGLLQKAFLSMQVDAAPVPGCGLHTLWSQGTAVTDRALEDESPARNLLSVSVAVAPLTVEAGRDFVMRLQQQRRGQQTGRYRGATVVETVEVGKLLVPEQPVAHLRQLPMEAVLAHQVSEVMHSTSSFKSFYRSILIFTVPSANTSTSIIHLRLFNMQNIS